MIHYDIHDIPLLKGTETYEDPANPGTYLTRPTYWHNGEIIQGTYNLITGYNKIIGLLVYGYPGNCTMRLQVDSQEILPKGFNMSLVAYKDYLPILDTIYRMDVPNVSGGSRIDFDLTVNYFGEYYIDSNGNSKQGTSDDIIKNKAYIRLYFLLE